MAGPIEWVGGVSVPRKCCGVWGVFLVGLWDEGALGVVAEGAGGDAVFFAEAAGEV